MATTTWVVADGIQQVGQRGCPRGGLLPHAADCLRRQACDMKPRHYFAMLLFVFLNTGAIAAERGYKSVDEFTRSLLPRRSLTCVRLLRHLPGRGAPRSWFTRLPPDGTGAQSRVARRAGAHGPLRAAEAGGDDPALPGAGTSRDVPRSGRSQGRHGAARVCQRRVRGLSRMRHSGVWISARALC